jgi:hypothetical protein
MPSKVFSAAVVGLLDKAVEESTIMIKTFKAFLKTQLLPITEVIKHRERELVKV